MRVFSQMNECAVMNSFRRTGSSRVQYTTNLSRRYCQLNSNLVSLRVNCSAVIVPPFKLTGVACFRNLACNAISKITIKKHSPLTSFTLHSGFEPPKWAHRGFVLLIISKKTVPCFHGFYCYVGHPSFVHSSRFKIKSSLPKYE